MISEKPTTAIALLDERISKATTQEMLELVYIRDQIIQQDETRLHRTHVRMLEKRNFYAKVGLSFCSFAGGIGLVVAEFGLPGFLCLGAGLYAIAPNFIDRMTDSLKG